MDFEYNGYTFSMPGGGVVRLSDVLTALNIPCEVSSLTKVVSSNTDVLVVTHAETDASEFEMYMAAHGLTEVMEAINAGLYADETEDETAGEFKDRIVSAGDWIVFSIAPFDTQETLTLVADNGTTYVVGFTDPASDGEFDITSMLTDVTLVIDGRDVTGNTWQVEEGQTYNLKLKFAEADFSQFPNSGTMYYQLPSGIYTENYSRTFDVKIRMNGKTYMLPGNTFTVNTDGEVRIQWNTEHPMYRYLLYSGNTSITLNLTGMFQKNTTQVIFSDTVTKTIEVKEIHDVSVTKQSTYNAATGKIHYVVQVTSAGENRPVSVHDTLGTALKIDGNVTITSNKGNMPSHTGSVKADNTGFDYTFGDASSGGLRDGEIITIEYDAVIDYDKIGKSGNATFNETKNVVNAEYPNDDNPGDNEASTYESNISFSTFGKDAVTMGNVYTEKEGDVDVMYRDITWKITANEDHSVSMEGSTFKDVNNSSNVMKYKGEGITVVITAPGNQATATETISYDSMAYHSDQGWGWTVPDEAPFKGKQKYEITYTTKVRIGDGSQNISVQNYAEGKGGSDSEQVPVWTGTGTVTPGPTGSGEPGPTPPPEIVANKAVTKSTADYVDWKITVMIPAEGYNDDFFVVDTLPSVYFNSQYVYDTYDSTTGVNVNGLVDGETYNVTDEDATVKIQFYDNDQDSPKGLKGTGASRVLTISLRTLVNQDWYDYAEEHGSYYWQHKNKATITANGATKETSAEAAPKRKSIKKVVQSTNNTFTDGNGITHRAFLYQIVLSSVDRDQIVINEVFDSSLKICPNTNKPDYRNLRVMGGNSYGPMSAQEFAEPTYATVQETATGARLIIDVPKKSGTFADYYYIEYYLYVANEELAVAKAQSNDGVALLGNTATWDGIPGHADVEYSYEGVGKSATQVYETDENGQQVPTDRFNYTIVLNPDKVRLNDGNNMIMTDTFTNLAIDYSSIKITFDPAQTGDYPFDYSGNVGTFTIPDETKVTITYQARIIGGQEGETITATNTAEMYGFMDSSTVSHTFSADAEGEGRVPSIRVLKYGENNMGQPFEGAVFQLYDANKQVITYPADAANGKAGQPVKFTTVSTDQKDLNGEVILNKGYALVTLVEHGENADGMTLQFDTVYYLREVEAPTINGVEYAVDNTYYQFQISSNDTADYDRYIYMDGDILKIRNYPKRYELKLVKKLNLPQDATMDDSQRANIRFEIKSVDTNGNPNGAYRKVVYFNNFDYDSGSQSYIYSLQDVPAGTYRVTEYGDDVYDYHLTAANVEYVTDGNDGTPAPSVVTPVGEESTPTIQFTMSQENELAEVKYTNNYEVRHTYYFTKVEQGNTSIRVPGTTFTVYNAADNTTVGEPYLTDENGKFSIYMDDGHNYQRDTLYYVMETQANPDYVLPDDPPKYYFYFGGTVSAPNGITPVNLGAASARQTVENEIKTVDIPVKKTWVGVVNMPASVTVKLFRRLVDSDDPWEETDKTLDLAPNENDDTKNWKGSFVNLDKDYEYKVEEVIPEGVYYAATYANNDGVKEQSADKTIEIINTTTLKNITVHKIWVDEPADDPNYQRPTAYFTLQVKKPDEGEWVNADNNGFAALYDDTWNNAEFNAIVKDKITVYGSITAQNNSCEWTNLPGRFIYRVVETDSNHNAYAEGQKIDEGKYVVTYDNAYTDGVSQGDVLITNTYNFTSLKVKKLWNTADVAPDSVSVSLYRNALFGETATYPASNPVWIGVPYSSNNNNIRQIELKKSENFQGEFTNLEKGYVYHLVETPVAGYTTTISDGNIYYGGETVTITNTKYTTDDKAIQVKKLWYDTEGNPMTDNLPDHVDVELKRISGHYDGHNVKVTFNHSGNYDIGSCQVKIANNSSISFTISAGDNGIWDNGKQYFDGTITESYNVISGSANVSVNIGDQNASHNIPITVTVENPTADCDIKVTLTPTRGSWLNGPVSVVDGYTPAHFEADGDAQSFEYNPSTTQSLNSGNNWAYKWTNLPADDGNGTAYLYTIEEKAVVDGQGNSHIQDYQLTIDDGNHGEGVPTGVIFLKNTKIPKGSLKLKKIVTVNGESTTTNLADGAYDFSIAGPVVEGEDPSVIMYVRILVENGVMTKYQARNDNLNSVDWHYTSNFTESAWAVVNDLAPGQYVVKEMGGHPISDVYTRDGQSAINVDVDKSLNTTLTGINGSAAPDNDSITLTVEAGDTAAAQTTAQATFTNNYETVTISAHKIWKDGTETGDADDELADDANADVEFELQSKVGDGAWTKVTQYADGTAVVNPKTIHGSDNWTATWNNLPKYQGTDEIQYRVLENKLWYRDVNYYVIWHEDGTYTVRKDNKDTGEECDLWVITQTVDPETGVITYTNTPKGALKLKKVVTVDDGTPGDKHGLVDGAYLFSVTGPDESTETRHVWIYIKDGQMEGYRVSTDLTNERYPDDGVYHGWWYKPYESGFVSLSGSDRWATVVDLVPGRYVVTEMGGYAAGPWDGGDLWIDEDAPLTNVKLKSVINGNNAQGDLANQSIALTVAPYDTTAEQATAQATFTNNVQLGSLKLKKLVQAFGAAPTSENQVYVDGAYCFTVTGPGDSENVKYIWIVVENGVATHYAIHSGSNYWTSYHEDWWHPVDENGWASVDHLDFGDYVVQEQGRGYKCEWTGEGEHRYVLNILENQPLAGVMLAGINGGTVNGDKTTVTVSTAAPVVQATFTNNFTHGSMTLKKVVDASVSIPVNGDKTKTNGIYAFTVKNTDDSFLRYVKIKSVTTGTKGNYTTSYTYIVSPSEITWSDSDAQPVPDGGIPFDDLVPGDYTIQETGWVMDGYIQDGNTVVADMALKRVRINGVWNDHIKDRKITVHVEDGTKVDMEFENELVPTGSVPVKMVADFNDSWNESYIGTGLESPEWDSADYDAGDLIPYRIKVNLPQAYFQSCLTYYYKIHDEMTKMTYNADVEPIHMYAAIKEGTTTEWYQVDEFFTFDTTTNPKYITATAQNLKAVNGGYKVTDWGGATLHGQGIFPAYGVQWEKNKKEFDIRYLQGFELRYWAKLDDDAYIGQDGADHYDEWGISANTGNPNAVRAEFSNKVGTDEHGFSKWDVNKVFTYQVSVKKTDEAGADLSGSDFQLYKMYQQYPNLSNTEKIPSGWAECDYPVGNTTVKLIGQKGELPSGATTTDIGTSKVYSSAVYVRVSRKISDDSSFAWPRIDDGEYLLVETNTPTDYDPLPGPVGFKVQATHEFHADDPQLTSLTVSDVRVNGQSATEQYVTFGADEATGIVSASVKNYRKKGNLEITKNIVAQRDVDKTGTFWYAVFNAADVEEVGKAPNTTMQPKKNTHSVRTGSIEVTANGTNKATETNLPYGSYYVFELKQAPTTDAQGEHLEIIFGGDHVIGGKVYTVTGSGTTATVGDTAGKATLTNTVPEKDFHFTKEWWITGAPNKIEVWPVNVTIPSFTLERILVYKDANGTEHYTTVDDNFSAVFSNVGENVVGKEPDDSATLDGFAGIRLNRTDEGNDFTYTVSKLPKFGQMTVNGTEYAGEWMYRVKEAQVSGYNAPVYLTSDHVTTNNQYADDNGIIQNYLITVALPATGGMGTGMIYGAGAALVLLAVLGMILTRRKRTDGEGIR